jgi:outer membrane protein OmpA-like peptidoglycan-associated protein
MKETEIEVTLLDIKNLYEYFYTMYRQPGLTHDWSLITCKNIKYLETPYNQISKGVYNEENDPKFYEFKEKYEKIVKKNADRDDQGTIIMENNQPKITELMVEFQKDKAELEKEYKDLLDKISNKNTINDKFLNQKVKIKIMIPNNDAYPNEVPPFVIDILTR